MLTKIEQLEKELVDIRAARMAAIDADWAEVAKAMYFDIDTKAAAAPTCTAIAAAVAVAVANGANWLY
jgi:hypothetical protein